MFEKRITGSSLYGMGSGEQAGSYGHLFVHLLTSMHAISRLESGVFQAYTIKTIQLPFFTLLYVLLCTQPLFATSHSSIVTKGFKFWSQLEVIDNIQRENSISAILELSFY
jgi:hypothetical protein